MDLSSPVQVVQKILTVVFGAMRDVPANVKTDR